MLYKTIYFTSCSLIAVPSQVILLMLLERELVSAVRSLREEAEEMTLLLSSEGRQERVVLGCSGGRV